MTAKISGLAAMAPGPLGLLTVLPDIVAMWRIQSQLVSDVAAVYGKTGSLSKEHLLWCLFKHSAAQTFRDVAYRVAERFLIQPLTMHALQKLTRVRQATTRFYYRGGDSSYPLRLASTLYGLPLRPN